MPTMRHKACTRGTGASHLSRAPILQRQCACGQHTVGGGECDQCRKRREQKIQQPDGAGAAGIAPPIVHEVLRAPGEPLDRATRAWVEPLFHEDFSNVRTHSDAMAASSAREVDASAYTVGRHIVFDSGAYAPHTYAGRRLLAHELAHTVQQRGTSTPGQGTLRISEPGDHWEQEASQSASRVEANVTPRIAPAYGARLARQAAGNPPAGAAQPAPAQKEPPKRPEQEGELGIKRSGFGAFDTELDRSLAGKKQPCRLTLTVNVNFKPQGPWPAGSFAKWQNELIQKVSNRWSFRFLLAPTRPCVDEPCQSATAILRVVPVTSSGANVQDVTVNYNKPAGARSESHGIYRGDTQTPGSDLRRGQTTATHEAGHWLGLEHIHCNTNQDNCYGTTDEESADVMGRGEIVSERDYAPFAEAISRITKCEWKPVGHGGTSLFGSSFVAPLALLGGAIGAVGGALLGASLGVAAAIGVGALFGTLGAGLGAATGLALNEVAR